MELGSWSIIQAPSLLALIPLVVMIVLIFRGKSNVSAIMVGVLVGVRTGLSSPDSLGVYMTHAPMPGLTDEARNCISNVRAAGLPVEEAVRKLCYLEDRRLSGVDLNEHLHQY